MCAVCGRTPCDYRCPNADEPASIGVCGYCGDEICVGEEFVELNDVLYHMDCVESDMPTSLLLALMNVDVKVAGKEDVYEPYAV